MVKKRQTKQEFQSYEANVQDVTIDDYIQAEVLKYGINASIFRMSPAFKDGLTPVKRRIIYSFYKDGVTFDKPRKKAVKLLGSVTGFHPHGNLSIEKAFTNEIKAFESNAILFDIHGNKGSATGMRAAAIRYLDAKLSRFATMCFFHKEDYFEELMDMTETYTRDDMEPVTLPSRYPYLLLSNVTGVGWGNSFSSVPFNLSEVFKLTQALIKNPNMTNVHLYPDSPRGYDIIKSDNIQEICDSGSGTLKIQARIEYGEEKDAKGKITKRYLSVMGLPEQTVMDGITLSISKMILSKTISGISSWEDRCYIDTNTGAEHVEFWLILTNDADPEMVKQSLYKKTQLRHYLTLNLNFAARTSMMHLGIKDALLMWISNRVSYKTKVISRKSYKLKERSYVLEGIIEILSPKNLDKTIGIIRHATDTDDAIRKLMETYGVSSYQARCVTDIKLTNLTRQAKQNFEDEINKIKAQINEINSIIGDSEKVKDIICEELEEGIKLFGRPRACRIISQDALKPIEFKYNIVVTKKYIKKLSTNTKSVGLLGSDDEIVGYFTNVSESTPIYIIDDLGKTYCVNLTKTKPTELSAKGNDLKSLIGLKGDPIKSFCAIDNIPDETTLTMFTKTGIIKQSLLKTYVTNRTELQGIILNPEDKVCYVMIYNPNDKESFSADALIYTHNGYGISIDLQSIPYTDRLTKGSNYLKLEDGDYVTGVCDGLTKELFVLTDKGYGKICEMDDIFKTVKRRAAMIKLISLAEMDHVIKIGPFNDNGGKYLFILQSGQKVEVEKSDIIRTTRISKGKKLVSVKKSDAIIKVRELE